MGVPSLLSIESEKTMVAGLKAGVQLHAKTLAKRLAKGDQRHLFIMMGLPASGKSTLAGWLEKQGVLRINRDTIRKRLYGDEAIYGDAKVVNAEYYRELAEALSRGGPVLSDNTNVVALHRKKNIALARDAGYEITIIWVDVPLAVCLERNLARARQAPEQVIRDLHAQMAREGFPPEKDVNVVVLNNGKDSEHYIVKTVRAVDQKEITAPRRFKPQE